MIMKSMLIITVLISGILLMGGCAPKASYQTADALGNTSNCAVNAAKSANQNVYETQKTQQTMKKEIRSVQEAEKLFDENSGIRLSY
jgi:hypothetical protein